jgi:DNA polymerase-1
MAKWLAPITALGVKDVVVLDTEFISKNDGNPVTPVCLSAKSLLTGKEWRLFAEPGAVNPLPTDPEVLYVTFAAPAEWSFFLAMGWELPSTIIDLYAERMMDTCEEKESAGKRRGKRMVPTLLRSMERYGLDAMSAAEKEEMRDLILRGHPFTDSERDRILDYCAEDVANTAALFEAMLPQLNVPYAIGRGNFTRVVGWWQFNGIPIDVPAYQRLTRHGDLLKTRLLASTESERGYGVYVQKPDGTMKWDKRGFETLVYRLGLQDDWPKTPSGRSFATADGESLPDDEKIFKQMASRCTYLEPLRQARKFVTVLRNFDLFIGDDSRSRVYPNPWWTNTGRANPRNSNFIFTLPKWVRPLIKPGPGQALAYVDLKSAEVGIAAGLSNDPNMKKCYLDAMNGGDDVYVGFAKLANAIPPDGNKETHPKERKLYKISMLATQYGQMPQSLAKKNGLPRWLAQTVHNKHKCIYARYWAWIENQVLHASVVQHMDTLFGWRRPVSVDDAEANTLLNYPIQAACSEILRLATGYMLAEGLAICACVHDAVLIEAPTDEIESAAKSSQDCWRRASAEYLGGFELGSDSKIIRYPARWGDNHEEDAEDIQLWNRIQQLLEEIDAEQETQENTKNLERRHELIPASKTLISGTHRTLGLSVRL